MPKAQQPDVRMDDVRRAFLDQIADLWDKHVEEFSKVLEESESQKIKLNFGATLDFSESKAKLETRMSFSQVVTDSRTAEFEDPNAPVLPFGEGTFVDEATPEPKPERVEPTEDEPEPEDEDGAEDARPKPKQKKGRKKNAD